jgi:DNA-binding response OmpR family regulator
VANKVLAVDDDPVIQRLLQVNLEMEGYEVRLASDGVEAVAAAREFLPDLILLDVMMPNKDGWEACADHQAGPRSRTPRSSSCRPGPRTPTSRGTEVGAAAYITKPFDPIDLLELELVDG